MNPPGPLNRAQVLTSTERLLLQRQPQNTKEEYVDINKHRILRYFLPQHATMLDGRRNL